MTDLTRSEVNGRGINCHERVREITHRALGNSKMNGRESIREALSDSIQNSAFAVLFYKAAKRKEGTEETDKEAKELKEKAKKYAKSGVKFCATLQSGSISYTKKIIKYKELLQANEYEFISQYSDAKDDKEIDELLAKIRENFEGIVQGKEVEDTYKLQSDVYRVLGSSLRNSHEINPGKV